MAWCASPTTLSACSPAAPDPRPNLRVIRQTRTTAVLDGDNGLGHLVGVRAMELAIEKAAEGDCAFVAVRNSDHYGTAAYYTEMAAPKGHDRDQLHHRRHQPHDALGRRRGDAGQQSLLLCPADGPGLPDRARHGLQYRGPRQDYRGGEGRRARSAGLGEQVRWTPDDRSGGGSERLRAAYRRPQGLRAHPDRAGCRAPCSPVRRSARKSGTCTRTCRTRRTSGISSACCRSPPSTTFRSIVAA